MALVWIGHGGIQLVGLGGILLGGYIRLAVLLVDCDDELPARCAFGEQLVCVGGEGHGLPQLGNRDPVQHEAQGCVGGGEHTELLQEGLHVVGRVESHAHAFGHRYRRAARNEGVFDVARAVVRQCAFPVRECRAFAPVLVEPLLNERGHVRVAGAPTADVLRRPPEQRVVAHPDWLGFMLHGLVVFQLARRRASWERRHRVLERHGGVWVCKPASLRRWLCGCAVWLA